MTHSYDELSRGLPILSAVLCLTLTACNGGGDDTTNNTEVVDPSTTGGTSGETTSDPSTTGETTNTPTTGAPTTDDTTTAASTTGGETGETTIAETGDDTTGGDTTGDPLDQACQGVCEKIYGCFPDEFYTSVEMCKEACLAQADGDQACQDAAIVFADCRAMMTCDDLLYGLVNEEYYECADEFETFSAACG